MSYSLAIQTEGSKTLVFHSMPLNQTWTILLVFWHKLLYLLFI